MKHLGPALFAATALATGGLSQSAHAILAVSGDFEVLENQTGVGSACAGSFAECGTFDVIDNSSIYSVIGFDVGMVSPPGADATTRSSWIAVTGDNDFGGGPVESFLYSTGGEAGYNPIGPQTSDSSFTWAEGAPNSPIEIFYVGPNGATGSCTGITGPTGCDAVAVAAPTPEPTSLGLLGLGLAALGAVRKQRRKA